VIIPKANEKDVLLNGDVKKKIKIVPVSNMYDVLKEVLVGGKKKQNLLKKIKSALK
jgi:predicted ATP-dependent protease